MQETVHAGAEIEVGDGVVTLNNEHQQKLADESLERARASVSKWLADPEFQKDLQASHERALASAPQKSVRTDTPTPE